MSKKTTTMPVFDKMMWPALQAFKASGGSASVQENLDRVVQLMGLSEEIQNTLHGDGPETEVAYRLAWARTYLKKVGAVENSTRGVWSITAAGRALTEADMPEVKAKARKTTTPAGKADDEEAIEESWKDQLLDIIKAMPADGFERLSQRILREAGFVRVEVTGRSGDGGIDGVGILRLVLVSFQVFFQCKKYAGTVGPGAIRDFRGAMVGRTDKGLFITTGRFTGDAKREASRDGAPPIELIDGEHLCDLLKQLKLGVVTELVEKVSVEPEFFVGI